MKNRTVNQLLFAHPFDMGGMPIRQPLPAAQVEQIDPFLLLHHAQIKVPKHVDTRHAGVGPHPHRGFSPVTFIFEGGVHHRDSRGNDSIIYAGGAQWMNAGRGLIHSERPPHNIHELGGRQELIQLWINTPAANKMDQPLYFPVTAEEAPAFQTADAKVKLSLFAGTLLGLRGPVASQVEVNAATLQLEAGGTLALPLPAYHRALVYVLGGKIRVEGFGSVEGFYLADFNLDGEGITLTGTESARVLLLSGKPLNEPLATHGPFVMNNQTELLEAIRDYQMGKMGVLIEE